MSDTPLRFERPSPLDHFACLVADDASLALTEAAAALAQIEQPSLDVQAVLADIDRLGLTLQRRLPADASALQRLRLLNHYFYQELGFAGNVNDYYAADNSYLHRVLATRRGIPISLAVLYMELAGQIGLRAHGVSFPGHFLVKLHLASGVHKGDVILDPFTGQSLSREELDERLLPYLQRQGLVGEQGVPLGLFLQSATPREVLARMLRNLKEIHRSAEDWRPFVAVQDRLIVLEPEAWDERRDRALALAELERHAAAAEDLQQYLPHCGDAGEHAALSARLSELRALARQRRPRLH
jgi:regulator of sirC expression with transglutaminase-like and TPR domain